jgi:hypothetical protein
LAPVAQHAVDQLEPRARVKRAVVVTIVVAAAAAAVALVALAGIVAAAAPRVLARALPLREARRAPPRRHLAAAAQLPRVLEALRPVVEAGVRGVQRRHVGQVDVVVGRVPDVTMTSS